MKINSFSAWVCMLLMAGSGGVCAHGLEQAPAPVAPRFSAPHEVVKIFLEAVKRGELVVMGRTLDASMLKPVRVEYVYELDDAVPRVMVYSEIDPPLSVPAHAGCRLRGIGAMLDADGHIVGTEAHLSAGP